MKVVCPSCGEFIPGADIDLGKSLAVCRKCGDVVALPAVVYAGEDGALIIEGNASFIAREVASVPLHAYCPSSLHWTERPDGTSAGGQRFHFTLTPARGGAVVAVIVAVAWNTFLWFWFRFIRSSDGSTLGVLRFWFPLLHLSAGCFLLYTSLCMLVNRTHMSMGAVRFSFEHGPLRESGGFSEPIRNIRCFIESQQVASTLHDRWLRQAYSWTVTMLTRDNRSVPMNLYLPERDQARYIALRLNRALDEMRAAQPRPGTWVVGAPEGGETTEG